MLHSLDFSDGENSCFETSYLSLFESVSLICYFWYLKTVYETVANSQPLVISAV